MFWSENEIETIMQHPVEGTAKEIGSPIKFIAEADLERDVIEEIREEFLEKDFDFAPVRPYRKRKYYDVKEGEAKEVSDEQITRYDSPIIYCLNILTEYEFALISHPDYESWRIVTHADLNKIYAKEYFYTYFSEPARKVSAVLEEKFGSAKLEKIYQSARNNGQAVGRWEDAKSENLELHLAEFMNLTDLKEVVKEEEELRNELGFDSKTKCEKKFKEVSKFRDRIMHSNKSLIVEYDEVERFAKAVNISSEIVSRCNQLLDQES